MKVPISWFGEMVDLKGIELPELIERLTLGGLEVASVRFYGRPIPSGFKTKVEEPGPVWDPEKIVTAKILSIEKHPNADKLKLVQLDYGQGRTKTVVTGAPNISVGQSGQIVVLGLTGCHYFDGHVTPKKIAELKPGNLRGIVSDAMVMSEFELGITDEHEGIILLEPNDPVGIPVVELFGETTLEIDILPNMARCLSMVGLAREVAALFGRQAQINEPTLRTSSESIAGKVNIHIEDPNRCARYSAMLIKNVQVAGAPGWMKRRLNYAGQRPISNVVDITNYVMLHWGQPLHAFDYDILVKRAGGQTPSIFVRQAKLGEKLKTLDGQERELIPEDIVIADSVGPIALAGVMGGAETEVTAETKTILLESANFDPVSIRKTAHRLTLFSEASTRFSRGISPETVPIAARYACQLLSEYAQGEVLSGMADSYPKVQSTQVVSLPEKEIARLLGVSIPSEEVERILTALTFQLTRVPEGWTVEVPKSRLDIQSGAADLIEELARIRGYDRLPTTLLSGELPPQTGNWDLQLEEQARNLLVGAALNECITYSLVDASRETAFAVGKDVVTLKNPLSPERSSLRRTLLPSLLEVAKLNSANYPRVALFELGPVFLPKAGERLPEEPRRIGMVLLGRRTAEAWDDPQGVPPVGTDFYDLKGVIEHLLRGLHVKEVAYQLAQDVSWLHPARAAKVLVQGQNLGHFGQLHPRIARDFSLPEQGVFVAELDWERLAMLVPHRFAYRPISPFPAAKRDIAVLVDRDISHEAIAKEIREAGGELLTAVTLFDVYTGEGIPEGKKSLAFALSYQALDRTLSDKDIDKAHTKVKERVKKNLKASIRGE
jgi:phenylalanyl-tRNA synthetase beta chain